MAKDKLPPIGFKLTVDGEREFKQAISDVNKSLSLVAAQAKKTKAAYDEHTSALVKSKDSYLTISEKVDLQTKKVESLKNAYEACKEQIGENDSKTKSYAQQLANAEAALSKMTKEQSEAEKEYKKHASSVGQIKDRYEEIKLSLESIKTEHPAVAKGFDAVEASSSAAARGGLKALEAAAAAVVAGLAAMGTAALKVGKEAVESFAEYEQLVGGVETLFKDSADKVVEYANEAYKTTGLSANEYLEAATSFSASLIASYSEDAGALTEEAADAMIEQLDKELEALEETNDKKLDELQKANEKEVEDYEKATDKKIELINKEYKEKIKLVDEEKYNALKAIDEQIEALNKQTEAEQDAIKKQQEERKRAELQNKINAAETAEEKKKLQQELSDFEADLAQKAKEKQRKQEIENLKEQKDAIKAEAEARAEAIKEEQQTLVDAYKESRKDELAALKEANKSEEEELKKSNQKQLEEQKKANEARAKELKDSIGKSLGVAEVSAEGYAKAAEMANLALIDMSDNANKMGTDMQSIQSAYQAFAKQNFTLLDNLKLGYGGTKAEMERLIEDANKLAVANGEAGDLTIDKFADVVEAIHLIQENMGIAGTTQKEALETISGSIGMLKSSWKNLITGLATDGADIDKLVNQTMESFAAVVDNLTPVINRVVEALPEVVSTIAKGLVKDDTIGVLMDSAIKLIDTLANDLISEENIKTLVESGVDIVENLVGFISENAGLVVDAASDLIVALCDSFGNPETSEILVNGAIDVVGSLVEALIENAPEIAGAAIEMGAELVKALVNYDWTKLAKNIFKSIKNSIIGMFKDGGKAEDDNESNASGLDYVPYNGYLAKLHKGERIMTASEAAAANNGGTDLSLINSKLDSIAGKESAVNINVSGSAGAIVRTLNIEIERENNRKSAFSKGR